MEPIEWTAGGWYRPVKDLPLPEPGQMPSLSDDFTSTVLGWQWTGWKEDITKVANLKKGTLTLPGRGTTPKDGRLMLVTATDTCYAIETEIITSRNKSSAGLIFYYNENAYAGVISDGKTFTIYQNTLKTETSSNPFGRHFKLRIENHNGTLAMKASADGYKWQTIVDGINVEDFHHNKYNGFLALRPALCSLGSGENQFRHFVYSNIE